MLANPDGKEDLFSETDEEQGFKVTEAKASHDASTLDLKTSRDRGSKDSATSHEAALSALRLEHVKTLEYALRAWHII